MIMFLDLEEKLDFLGKLLIIYLKKIIINVNGKIMTQMKKMKKGKNLRKEKEKEMIKRI